MCLISPYLSASQTARSKRSSAASAFVANQAIWGRGSVWFAPPLMPCGVTLKTWARTEDLFCVLYNLCIYFLLLVFLQPLSRRCGFCGLFTFVCLTYFSFSFLNLNFCTCRMIFPGFSADALSDFKVRYPWPLGNLGPVGPVKPSAAHSVREFFSFPIGLSRFA